MLQLTIENLFFRYPNTKKYLLKAIHWEIQNPSIIGLLGTNGCGKTTFLKLIIGSLTPTQGRILFNNKTISKFKQEEGIVYVPENARLFLVGPTPRKDLKRIIKDQEKVDLLIEHYNFDKLADKKLYNLSEGQRRLFALFTAFQLPSKLILLDEPTIGLDFKGRSLLFHLLEKAKQEDKLVFVSSNDSRVFPKLDELIVIQNGSFFLTGPPIEVLYNLEDNTELIPNQIIRLIIALEKQMDRKFPHFLTPEEFNQSLNNGGFQ